MAVKSEWRASEESVEESGPVCPVFAEREA